MQNYPSMLRFLLTVFIGFTVFSTNAQPGFVTGYIVNAKGDTVKGEVKPNVKKEHEAYIKVVFKDANGVQKTYKPNKIKGYGFNDQNFVGMDLDGELNFYRLLAKGEINFYKLMFEAMHMNEIVYESEYYISHPDNKKMVLVKESKFKKQMLDWMKDNQEFINTYDDDKKFDSEKAIEVIKQYNAWKAGQ